MRRGTLIAVLALTGACERPPMGQREAATAVAGLQRCTVARDCPYALRCIAGVCARQCGMLPEERAAAARGGEHSLPRCDNGETMRALVPHEHRTCRADADCVAQGGHACATIALNRAAAALPEHQSTRCTGPGVGCARFPGEAYCVEGCCEGARPHVTARGEPDPFGAPPLSTSPNCGPEFRWKFDVSIGSPEALVRFVQTHEISSWVRFPDHATNGQVDWAKVRSAVQTNEQGGRKIYSLPFNPHSECHGYTLRATEDGHVSLYGCCGK